ncbi:hypothetical protein Syun_031026 [Stephania yunnanensis]|uniref:Uncharacterized protein n=1 Tax=Stephania yunnanensis TaxID=152371 RepID=A0AAP0HGC8_9MAGN
MENILDSLLFLMRIWAESVNKLILLAIRMVREFFALAMEKVNIIDCFGLLEGFIDDSNDDKMILKLKSEFEDDGHDKYSSSIPGFYSEYLLRKSVMDMAMCIKKHSTHPMTCLLEFLSTTADDGSVELLKKISSSSSDELVLLVCLVRMADSLASSLRIVPLASALDQAFEIIVFIHAKTITKSGSNAMKINVAKDIWMNKSNSNHWFQTNIIDPLKRGCANHIRDCIAGLFDNYLLNFVICELYDIINIIGEPRVEAIRSTNGSVEELYDRIEQLFAELLLSFFDQLPNAIFNSLNERVAAVEFKKNAKIWMKLVTRFTDVDPKHYANRNIGSFMTTDMPAEQENHEAVGDYASLGNEGAVSDANVIKANGTNRALWSFRISVGDGSSLIAASSPAVCSSSSEVMLINPSSVRLQFGLLVKLNFTQNIFKEDFV